jgi:ribosome-associated protein
MIEVTPDIMLDESEFEWRFVRGSGPGGQNVNKVATTAQLKWDAMGSDTLSDDVKERLVKLAGRRISRDGYILIEAANHRTQNRNRQEALDRLVRLVRRAVSPPKPRRPTLPSKSAKAKRLEGKRRHAAKKRQRRFNPERDW